eukprot:g45807.t1
MVAQWLALLPHSSMDPGLILPSDKIVFDPSKCRLWRAVYAEQELITQGIEDVSFLLYRLKLKRFLSENDQEEVEKQSNAPSKLDTLLRVVLKKNSNLEIRKFTSVLVAIDGLKPELSKWVQNLEEMGILPALMDVKGSLFLKGVNPDVLANVYPSIDITKPDYLVIIMVLFVE